jgi:hypothetical protein
MVIKKRESEKARRLEEVWGRLFIHKDGKRIGKHKPIRNVDYRGQYALQLPSNSDKKRDYHGHMLDMAYNLWKHEEKYSDEDFNNRVERLKEYGSQYYLGSGPATKLSKEAALEYTDIALKELRGQIKSNKSSNQDRFYLKKIEEVRQMRKDIKSHWNEIEGLTHVEKRRKHKDLTEKVLGIFALLFGLLGFFIISTNITGNVIGIGNNGNKNIYGLTFIIIGFIFSAIYFWKKRN